jgi:hypothetical protein
MSCGKVSAPSEQVLAVRSTVVLSKGRHGVCSGSCTHIHAVGLAADANRPAIPSREKPDRWYVSRSRLPFPRAPGSPGADQIAEEFVRRHLKAPAQLNDLRHARLESPILDLGDDLADRPTTRPKLVLGEICSHPQLVYTRTEPPCERAALRGPEDSLVLSAS